MNHHGLSWSIQRRCGKLLEQSSTGSTPVDVIRPRQALSKDGAWPGRTALSGELRGTVRAVRVRIPLAFLGPRQALSEDRAWHGSNYDIMVTCSIRFEQCGFESHCRKSGARKSIVHDGTLLELARFPRSYSHGVIRAEFDVCRQSK